MDTTTKIVIGVETLRVCPECGYIDDRMWRVVPWRRQVDYARMDLFEEKYPEFAAALKNGGMKKDEGKW